MFCKRNLKYIFTINWTNDNLILWRIWLTSPQYNHETFAGGDSFNVSARQTTVLSLHPKDSV